MMKNDPLEPAHASADQSPSASSRLGHRQTVPNSHDEMDLPPPYSASSRSSTSSNHGEHTPLTYRTPSTTGYVPTEAPTATTASACGGGCSRPPTNDGYHPQPAMAMSSPKCSQQGASGCCFSDSGGCCFSSSGGCCFSSNGGCCFSDNGACCFSDHSGCCFSDHSGCCFGDNGECGFCPPPGPSPAAVAERSTAFARTMNERSAALARRVNDQGALITQRVSGMGKSANGRP